MYNPYDLIEVQLEGQRIYARPITFNDDLIDHIKMTGTRGDLIVPNQLSMTCPTCGQGFDIHVSLTNPPFPVLKIDCPYCVQKRIPEDPFRNPIEDGIIKISDLNPHKPAEVVLSDSTVESRMPFFSENAPEPQPAIKEDQSEELEAQEEINELADIQEEIYDTLSQEEPSEQEPESSASELSLSNRNIKLPKVEDPDMLGLEEDE